jgi:hypothetical protein
MKDGPRRAVSEGLLFDRNLLATNANFLVQVRLAQPGPAALVV